MSNNEASGLRAAIDTTLEQLTATTVGSPEHAVLAKVLSDLWRKYSLAVAFGGSDADS